VRETFVRLTVDATITGLIKSRNVELRLEDVTAVYLRPHGLPAPVTELQTEEDRRLWRHAASVDHMLLAWADLAPGVVVNRPAAAASNGSKPYQSMLIRRFGFEVPDTLVTTDPEEAEAFLAEHGEIIYKSVSGIRSIVSRFAGDKTRLADVVWCPTQFQQYVAGRDYRVHVIGNEVYACEIFSDADDYRYASRSGKTVEVRPTVLPAGIADQCLSLGAGLDLIVAGIDLRLGYDGRWYCFEVNPSPGFTYYEHASGQSLSFAIANLLARTP
jgi:glutathione synthase/RimK-type ligase-like ATP-grasp enzyme